jgi:membrane-associated phospholipid phosphatase
MPVRGRRIGVLLVVLLHVFVARPRAAWAQSEEGPAQPSADASTTESEDGGAPSSSPGEGSAAAAEPPKPPDRPRTDLTPRPAEPAPSGAIRFTADPVADTGLVALALTFTLLSSEILSTGEVRPQQISPTFRSSQLLGIDRGAITQRIDSHADRFSNYGLYAALTYVAADVVADVFRDGAQTALVDAVMYLEAGLITQAVTNVAKIAFRRPRPIAYIERNRYIESGGDPRTYDNSDTDSSLSFFSGHASGVAALSAAATYIAFSRSRGPLRPWLTLVGGAALTSFVSFERVRSGAHFPTDVIAGALAGTAVGSLVVHFHREDTVRQRPIWVGLAPLADGTVVSASGVF